jgi:phasin family protein
MADQNNSNNTIDKAEAKAAAEAPAKVAGAVADTAQKLADESNKTAKRERAKTARRAKRATAGTKTTTRRAKTTARKTRTAAARNTTRNTRTAARKTAAAAQQGFETVTNTNPFNNGFDAIPAFAPFQNLFADVNGRGQEMTQRSQKVAEELADLARSNVEAVVEASRVAAQGARSLGQDMIAASRDNVEQAADAVRTLAEAKSPTEYMQLQGDFARASFDRMVAESSRLTETMVKLAGEAFQPLSNRATANAERFNTFVA